MNLVDLRSDTVTVPTDEMRAAIAAAEVGDDVYHDDPTVLALEERMSDLLGTEDAVYTPTGTMANQIALRTRTDPGDVILAARDAHIDHHELGAANALSGLTVRQIGKGRGIFTAADVEEMLPDIPDSMPSALFQPVSLVACENTHNASGGTIWPLEEIDSVASAAASRGIATHLDGARLWNASVASGIPEERWARGFDTVAVCFSKGLGAPMGSALAGPADVIERSRRFKQMFGGGFRQAGMMAAGALFAVDNHRERLADDHDNATRLSAGLAEMPGIDVDTDSVHSNMVYFSPTTLDAGQLCAEAETEGVLILPLGGGAIRAVTHLGVDTPGIDRALEVISSLL